MKKRVCRLGLSAMLITSGYGATFTVDNNWSPKTSFPSSQDTTLIFTTNGQTVNRPNNRGIIYHLHARQTLNGNGWLNLIFDTKINKANGSGYIQNNGWQDYHNRNSLIFNRKIKAVLTPGSSVYEGVFSTVGSWTHILFWNDIIIDSSQAESKQSLFGERPKLAIFARNGGSIYVNANETQEGEMRDANTVVQINGDIGIGGGGNGYINLGNKDSYINGKIFNEHILALRIYNNAKISTELNMRGTRTTINLQNTKDADFKKVSLTRGTLSLDARNSDFTFNLNQQTSGGNGRIDRANITNSNLTGHFVMNSNTKLNFTNSTFKGYVGGGSGGHVSIDFNNSDWIVTNNSYANVVKVTTNKEEPIQLLYNEDGRKRKEGGRTFSIRQLWSDQDLKFSIIVNPEDKSDKVEIQQGSLRTHLLEFHLTPDTSTTITKKLVVAKSSSQLLSFDTLPTVGGLAVYKPILERENNGDWVVKSFEKIQETPNAILSTLSTLPFAQLKLYTNSLNKRLGDLKEYRYEDGVWARTSYAQQSSQKRSDLDPYKNQHFLFQGGYDRAFRLSFGQNFLGTAFEYGHSWVKGGFFEGEGDTVGLVVYNTLVTHQRFYIDTLFKYLYSAHHINLNAPFIGTQKIDSHFVYGSAEVGHKFIFQHLFFLQPLIEFGVGYIPKHSLNFQDDSYWHYKLISDRSSPLFLQTGAFVGVELKGGIKGDVRFGAFFEYDNNLGTNLTLSDANTKIPYKDLQNYRLALKIGTNLHLSKDFRIYLNAQNSFFGYINTDYEVNLGIRYMFGKYYDPSKGAYKGRDSSRIARDTIYDIDQSRLRAQKRLLTQEELDSQLYNQSTRTITQVQNNTQNDRRMRHLKKSSNWINTQANEENYQGRNVAEIQNRDQDMIRRNNQKESARKYGQ